MAPNEPDDVDRDFMDDMEELECEEPRNDDEPRCDCGHLFEICGAPHKCW